MIHENEHDTDDALRVLAGLLDVPEGDVLHYAIVVRQPGGIVAQQFCGMPADALVLLGLAVAGLAASQTDMAAVKMALGCTSCEDLASPEDGPPGERSAR